jgi:hypothetical protein
MDPQPHLEIIGTTAIAPDPPAFMDPQPHLETIGTPAAAPQPPEPPAGDSAAGATRLDGDSVGVTRLDGASRRVPFGLSLGSVRPLASWVPFGFSSGSVWPLVGSIRLASRWVPFGLSSGLSVCMVVGTAPTTAASTDIQSEPASRLDGA